MLCCVAVAKGSPSGLTDEMINISLDIPVKFSLLFVCFMKLNGRGHPL